MKICKVTGCNNPVFGKGYCKFHQYKREDIVKSIKRSPLRKKYKPTGELPFFLEIWRERLPVSFVSQDKLERWRDTMKFVNLFAHVIRKGGSVKLNFVTTEQRDRLLRFNKKDVVLLTPTEHYLWDNGTEEQREAYKRQRWADDRVKVNWNRLHDLEEKLIEEIKQQIENERCK